MEQALVREVKEETSLTVKADGIVAVNEAKSKEKGVHTLFITFKAVVVEGKIAINDREEEIQEIEWVDIKRANEYMPYHLNGVERLLQMGIPYIYQD